MRSRSRSSERRSPGCARSRRCGARATTAASSRSAPSRTCPYDRPPLSKELLAGTAEPDDIVLRKQGVDDLDVDWMLGAPADRARRRRAATVDARRRHARRVRRPRDRDRLDAAPAARTSPTSTACSCCARSTTRSRSASRLDARPQGRRDRRRVHRRRGRGDVPRARARRDRARSAAAADGARARPRARRGDRRHAPRPRRRPAHRRAGRGDRRRRARRARAARRRQRRSTPTSWWSASASCPATDWLEGSGLTLDNGVVCDETCLAAPGIVAAGDIARWPNPLFDGELMRLEHWTNATEQGVHAARTLLAGDGAGASRSRRCRSCGPTSTTARSRPSASCRPTPTCTSRTARTRSGSSSSLFGRGGRIVGALGFNRPRQVMQYRKLIAERGVVGRRARARERMSDQPRSRAPDLHAAASRSSCRAGSATSPRSRCSRRCCPTTSRSRSGTGASRSASRSARSRSARSCCARSPGGSATRVGRRVLDRRRRADRRGLDRVLRARARAVVPRARCASSTRLRRGRLLRRRGDDDHRPRAGRAARRSGELLVGRGVRRPVVRPGARVGAARRTATTASVWIVSAGLALARRDHRACSRSRSSARRPSSGRGTCSTAPRSGRAPCCSSG